MQRRAIVPIHILCHPSLSHASSFWFCFSLYHPDLHLDSTFFELIHEYALNGWCPFLASIDDGLPEEKIEPSHALFQPATIFPVGPTAHVFSSVMMAHILNGCCPFLVLIGVVWNPLFLKCLCCKQKCVQIYLH